MPKRQMFKEKQRSLAHTVLICLSVWEVEFTHHLMQDAYMLFVILIQEHLNNWYDEDVIIVNNF